MMIIHHILIFLTVIITVVLSCSDFVFLIDTDVDDNPLGRNLQRRRDLVLKTAQKLDLNSGIHRVSTVIYGKREYDKLLKSSFEDNQDTDKFLSDLKKEFDSLLIKNTTRSLLPSIGTSDAIDLLLRKILLKRRMGSPVVVLIFTDGRLRNNELKKLEHVSLLLAKKYYVHTFVINPENSISIERLSTMETLTNGDKKSIITSQNRQISSESLLNKKINQFITCQQFAKSKVLRRKPNNLVKASTVLPLIRSTKSKNEVISSTIIPSLRRLECQQDIVLLMDFSKGTGDKREEYLNLAVDLVKNLKLGPKDSQIAFVRYSGHKRTDTVFHLKKHLSNDKLISEMLSTTSIDGITRTGEAILEASNEFNQRYGGRLNAKKIMIVFTDGYSQDDPLEATLKIQKNIHIYSVAINDKKLLPNIEQLKYIASDTKSVYFNDNFDELKKKIIITKCQQ